MGKVLVMGDRYTVSLFRLLGTEGKVIEDPLTIEDHLRELRKREDLDVVLITKDIYEPIREKIDSFVIANKKPLIGIIPSPFSEAKPIDVRKIILKALGFG
ncbi:MAG: V-type ATP synthase subunit F [Sulfolobaceae archaeon]